jgi:MoaA/NifB/PqqE/SkfB family radical SAM enzyme
MELCFTGGEPLARSDFLDIYTYAKGKGFLISVFTNGTLVTKKIADYWVQHPPSMIEISFHGLTKGTFESITQGHRSYEHCLLGIRLVLERNLPLTLKTTGMTMNRDEVLKIKEYVSRLGDVRYKFGGDIRPRLDGSEDVYEHQLPQEEIAAIERADQEFRVERARQDRARDEALAEGRERCAGGKHKFHIDAYGQLQLCSNNRERSYDLRRGSFHEGFYEVLPTLPCTNRQSGGIDELVSIENQTRRQNAEARVS